MMKLIEDHYYFCRVKGKIQARKLIGVSFGEIAYLDDSYGSRIEIYIEKDLLDYIGPDLEDLNLKFPEYFI